MKSLQKSLQEHLSENINENKSVTVRDAKAYFKHLLNELNKWDERTPFEIEVYDNAGGTYITELTDITIRDAYGQIPTKNTIGTSDKCWLMIE